MQRIKNTMIQGIIIIISVVILFVSYIYIPKLLITPDNKFTVLMAGQSVTDHWFRYRELPAPLNAISIWKSWPIPYDKHVSGSYYFKQLRIPSPRRNEIKSGYGAETLTSIQSELDKKNYNALMFKFCFTDFLDGDLHNEKEVNNEFNKMTTLVKKVHNIAKSHNTKLILGNALPLLKPNDLSQQLRIKYNSWVNDYAINNTDIVTVDLYDNLVDKYGRLKVSYSLDPGDDDSHLKKDVYKILENELSSSLKQLNER
jgi:hypothetical protein